MEKGKILRKYIVDTGDTPFSSPHIYIHFFLESSYEFYMTIYIIPSMVYRKKLNLS